MIKFWAARILADPKAERTPGFAPEPNYEPVPWPESASWGTVRTVLGDGTVLEFSFAMDPTGSGYYRILEE